MRHGVSRCKSDPRLCKLERNMRLLLRWFFNLLCLISLLVCLCVLAVGVRSFWIGDMWLWYEEPLISHVLRLGHGHIQYAWQDVSMMTGINMPAGYYRQTPDESTFTNLQLGQTHFAFAGLLFERSRRAYGDYMLAQMHLSWPLVLSALLPALWVIQFRRRRRRLRKGHCRVCG